MPTLISDSFVGSAGAITGHVATTPALPWESIVGVGNNLVLNGSGAAAGSNSGSVATFALAPGEPASADYDVVCKIVRGSNAVGALMGVGGRVNAYGGALEGYIAAYDGSGIWHLYKYIAGTPTELGTPYAQALTNGVEYTLMLRMVGTSIKLLVNGVERVTATDSAITAAGRSGLYWYSAAQIDITSTEFSVTGDALLAASLIFDNFTGEEGPLSEHFAGVPVARWGAIAGTPDVYRLNGYGGVTGDRPGGFIAGTAAPGKPPADCEVSAIFAITGPITNLIFGVFGRMNASAYGFAAYTARYFSGQWQLYRMNEATGSSQVLIGTPYAQVLTAGVSYKLTLKMDGNTISLLVDDVQRVTGSDSGLPNAGKCGLIWYTPSDNAAYATEFRVTADDPITFEPPILSQTGGDTGNIVLDATVQIGGEAPVVYDLYRDNTPEFAPGAGNLLASGVSFPYTDADPLDGKSFYRVKATDDLGNVLYSRSYLAERYAAKLQVLFVGDSLTDEDVAWPETERFLQTAGGTPREVQVVLAALSGSVSEYWATNIGGFISSAIGTHGFTSGWIASICLGTNDCSLLGGVSKAAYKANIASICAQVNAAGGIAVLHLPPMPEPYRYVGYIDEGSVAAMLQYEDALDELSRGGKIRRGDRQAFTYYGQNMDKSRDGVHPTAEGYLTLGRFWGQGIIAALGTPPSYGGYEFY